MGSRTRTVLFTDMADYTATVARSDRAALVKLLVRHEEAVAPVVQRYHGRVVKNLGDSFMCLFDAATDALRAAVELQTQLAQSGDITVRVAATTGDVEEIDGDAFGEPVNLAARILARTPAGEVWFGPGTRACMNPSEIAWEAIGRFSLKGIVGEVDVFRAVPPHRCWLPEPVIVAQRRRGLLRVRPGEPLPTKTLAPEGAVLIEGFTPGTPELDKLLADLPVIDSGSLFLATWLVSPAVRHAWIEAGRGLVIGTPEAIERALAEASRVVTRSSASDTLMLPEPADSVEIVVSGLALPSVPIADVVTSYVYDLDAGGHWRNRSDACVVRVEVLPEGPRLHVTSGGVRVDGRPREVGEVVPLRDGQRVEAAGRSHIYRALTEDYVGCLLSDTPQRLTLTVDRAAEIGREPGFPGLAFPDRRGQENLRWSVGPRAEKARVGGFTLDRALAGRRQASFELVGGEVRVTPLHDRCVTWRMRASGGAIERLVAPTTLGLGDEIIAGTTVIGLRAAEQGF